MYSAIIAKILFQYSATPNHPKLGTDVTLWLQFVSSHLDLKTSFHHKGKKVASLNFNCGVGKYSCVITK